MRTSIQQQTVPAASGKAARRLRRSPGSERRSEGGDDQNVCSDLERVADGLARGELNPAELRIFRR